MATISTRVDENTKQEAEAIAQNIGISLSAAVNIFLKRFILEKGFPFHVSMQIHTQSSPIVDAEQLDSLVKRAIANPDSPFRTNQFSYLDSETNRIQAVNRKE